MMEKNMVAQKDDSAFQMVKREFLRDKWALTCLVLLSIVLLTIFVWSLFLDQDKVMTVDILRQYERPGVDGMLLGADQGGRDVLAMLILGAKNSIMIGLAVTVLMLVIGILFGVIAGYYGGIVDNLMMRFLDFMMTLPMLLLVIVIVSIIPHYTMMTFVLVMGAFYWVSTARLIRSKALSEARKDYISAAKTSGTSDLRIIFGELIPNLSSIIVVEAILSLTANIGIEVGLTFLGFGLPDSVPSLGTLISYAQDPDVLTAKFWVWLPASLLILFICVGISYVGNVVRRTLDARQRLG
ncbi:ABC transporter permease [Lactobacillus intestinalis]|uniref:ABC transporter permease n=1 Tax=Lactobacillus intestinalis TaxID=151781 RepID=UPI0026F111FE|nr:ABC transporter permease [Lactobacillus intestinalis]